MLDFEETEIPLKKACTMFKLCPRSVKCVVYVFKIMKFIWLKKRVKDDDNLKDLKKHSILLLVMASSDRTKRGIQTIFNLMEKDRMPEGDNSLQALIKKHCDNGFDEGTAEKNALLDGFDHPFNNDTEWNTISEKFQLARSFSFF